MTLSRGSSTKLALPLFILVVAFLTSSVLVCSLVRVDVLVVESINGSSFTLRVPRVITIEYNHSVEKGKVVETLEAGSDCIRLVSLIWQGHGAGMPSSLRDIEGVLRVNEGLYEVKVDRCLGQSITVNLDYMVEGRLTVNGLHFTSGVHVFRLEERALLRVLLDELVRYYPMFK